MAKEPKQKTYKLDLTRTLAALDRREFSFYESLTDEERKGFSPLILMRYMSVGPDSSGSHAYHLAATNDLVNIDFWALSKYPDLMAKLLCLVGLGKKEFHQWIGMTKKKSKGKLYEFFKQMYPDLNKIEYQILLRTVSEEELESLMKDYALEDKETKELKEEFRSSLRSV